MVIPRPDGVSNNDSTAEAKPKAGAPPLLDNLHAEAMDALGTRSAKSGAVNDGGAGTKGGAGAVPRPEGTPTAVIGHDGSINFVSDSPVEKQTPKNVTVDKQGRVTKVSYPDQSSTQFSYNDGKLDQITMRDGEVDQLINGEWMTEAGNSSKEPVSTMHFPADITGVHVNSDGSWGYSSKEGVQFATSTDGTQTITDSKTKMVATFDRPNILTSITLDGKTYKSAANSTLVSADGKATNMMDVQVLSSGEVYYQDKQTGQEVGLNPDGSKNILSDHGDVISNSRGQIESVSTDHSFSRFTYGANGQISSYSANGEIYSSQGGGIFKDKNGSTISQLQVSSEGDITYTNQAGKLVSDNINDTSTVSAEKISPDNTSVTTNTNGEVTAVTYADGSSRQFSYNENRQLTGFTYSKDKTHTSYTLKNGQWSDSHGSKTGWSQVDVNGAGSFSYTNQSDGTTVTALTDGSTQTFSPSGFSSESNAKGQVVQYSDGHGNTFESVNGIFKSKNGDTLIAVNNDASDLPPGDHRVDPNDDSDGAGTSYLVQNAKHQPVEVIYSNGQSRQYSFDAHGHVDQITQPTGIVDKLIDGRWLQSGDTNSDSSFPAMPGKQSWTPSDLTNVQVGSDGALSYLTAQGAQVTYYGDGTSTTHTKDQAFVSADVKGNVTSVIYGNGTVSTFTYGTNGQLTTVNDNGTDYYQDSTKGPTQGEWLNAQGQYSNKSGFNVEPDGTLSYQDTETGQTISKVANGTTEITNTDNSTLTRNSKGQIVAITRGSAGVPEKMIGSSFHSNSSSQTSTANPSAESFSYDTHGNISQFTASNGQVYSRQANGDFADKSGDTLSNVQLSAEGNLSYINSDAHVVIASRSGTTFTSEQSLTQLAQAAQAIHSGQSASSSLQDKRIGNLIDGLDPADLAALQLEYKQKYGSDLSSDLATNVGAPASSSIDRLLSANIEMTTGKPLPPDTNPDMGEQTESHILLAYKLGVPVSASALEVLNKAALAQSESNITPNGVDQTHFGNCYFDAALAGLAGVKGGAEDIRNKISVNADGSYTVKFDQPGGKTKSVNVNSADLAKYATGDGSLWANVMETAFLKQDAANPFDGSSPGKGSDWLAYGQSLLTRDKITGQSTSSITPKDLETSLKNGDLITVATGNESKGSGIVGGHAYTVADFDSQTNVVKLRNPWGVNGQGGNLDKPKQTVQGVTDDGNGYVSMSYATFVKNYYAIDVSSTT
jgi:YD repeat-containing protein